MRKCRNVFELGMPKLTCVHCIWVFQTVPYFFGYKTDFFPSKTIPKRSISILKDRSRCLGLFRKGKIGIIAKFHWPDLVI